MKSSTLLASSFLLLTSLSASAATLCENGKSDYAIVAGTNVQERIAAEELQDIFERSTGVRLPVVAGYEVEVKGGGGQRRGKFIYVGYTAEAEEAFGKDDLKENEYGMNETDHSALRLRLSTSTPHAIWLRGTSGDGTMLAAYRFCEDALGYRCFTPEKGGERILKKSVVKTDGKGFRFREAFPMGRSLTHVYLYGQPFESMSRFLFRNGGFYPRRWCKTTRYRDYVPPINGKDSGHGFFLYITTREYAKNDIGVGHYPYAEKIDFFKDHPEWFSMNAAGKRTNHLQLCFTNEELQDAFIKRVFERCRQVGGEGVLTIGANDVPGPFCLCPKCKALAKEYEQPGAAYYVAFLPKLLAALEKEFPKIKVSTLAYRKEQTENFPKGLGKFKDNFICDFTEVDDDQAHNIGETGNEKTLENLKKWCAACKTVMYWYYACTKHPFGPVTRVSREMKIIDEAGTDEVKLCGLYSPGLGEMLDYLYLRMALDPEQDPWARVKEYCDFSYGPASAAVESVIRDLDRCWRENPTPRVSIDQGATTVKIYKAPDLVRWQKILAEAEKTLGDDPNVRRNFALVRWDIDMLTLQYWREVRDEVAKCGGGEVAKLTPDAIYNRMKTVTLQARYQSKPEAKGKEATGQYAVARNAYLVALALDKPLPAPLDKLPADQVTQLPQCGGCHGVTDPAAICGFAKSEIFPTNMTSDVYTKHLVSWWNYDTNQKRTLKYDRLDCSKATPGKYELYKLGKIKIAPGSLITFASWWGIGESLANYYPEGDADREFELWASLKFVGPHWGIPTDDNRNRMYCDALYLVDKNGKKYKGE